MVDTLDWPPITLTSAKVSVRWTRVDTRTRRCKTADRDIPSCLLIFCNFSKSSSVIRTLVVLLIVSAAIVFLVSCGIRNLICTTYAIVARFHLVFFVGSFANAYWQLVNRNSTQCYNACGFIFTFTFSFPFLLFGKESQCATHWDSLFLCTNCKSFCQHYHSIADCQPRIF